MNKVTLDTAKLDALIRSVPNKADAMLQETANAIANDAKLSFGSGPPGNAYPRGNVTHVASSPGYPPNIDTGALRASVGVTKVKRHKYAIHDGVEYGIWLELGTATTQPRPWLKPAFERGVRQLADRIDLETSI